MALQLLFLGTGTSAGVPMIGCDCAVCRSTDPRDQRTRPSVMVSYPDGADPRRTRRFIIDTAPELRLQMIRHDIRHIDGVIYTHAHADHILGTDDLRRFNAVMGTHLDIFADQRTLDILRNMFRYIFEPHNNVNQSFVATLTPHLLEAGKMIELAGARWTPLPLLHGKLPILGYRVDFHGASLAYCTDVSHIPDATFPLLAGLDVLVIDGLRYRPHPTHLTVDAALQLIARIKPRAAYLTHLAHDIRHQDLEKKLPEGVFLPYDGLSVEIGERA